MLKPIIYFTGLYLFLIACNSNPETSATKENKDSVVIAGNPCEKYFAAANRSDEILMRAQVLDQNVATKAISDFNAFASNCTSDSLAPVFYLKAGQVAQAAGKYMQALDMFNKCIIGFPDFKNRGAALFLSAQLYDDAKMLNDEAKAKQLYEQIMKEYPKSDYARDSKSCIQNLGKTDDELVEEFLKKSK